ncbi:MAG: hypothetical protein WBL11_02280 [Bacteroidales bacterium]|nr:hypothetical protein [Bacteroidales bacterium]MDD3755485.1 hypothetical protein [Bacteroidales bacterium]MDI9575394.1 hypothetical protein [Bacteroidota bacterium]MDY0401543.1 hypothetical protein [Bacteroidales bacterium]HHW60008.1 hypothetical protein [Bacteroidales bacterium]
MGRAGQRSFFNYPVRLCLTPLWRRGITSYSPLVEGMSHRDRGVKTSGDLSFVSFLCVAGKEK